MKLADLTLAEKASLLGSRTMDLVSFFQEKSPEEATEQDLRNLRDKLNRLVDLFEECELDGGKNFQ